MIYDVRYNTRIQSFHIMAKSHSINDYMPLAKHVELIHETLTYLVFGTTILYIVARSRKQWPLILYSINFQKYLITFLIYRYFFFDLDICILYTIPNHIILLLYSLSNIAHLFSQWVYVYNMYADLFSNR